MGNDVSDANGSSSSSDVPPMKVDFKNPVPSDIDISQAITPLNISIIANKLGLLPSDIDLYGSYKAKVKLSVLDRLKNQKSGSYVVVTGMSYLFFLSPFL